MRNSTVQYSNSLVHQTYRVRLTFPLALVFRVSKMR